MNNKNKMYNLGELFCGPGGFAEGAKKTGFFRHVWPLQFAIASEDDYVRISGASFSNNIGTS